MWSAEENVRDARTVVSTSHTIDTPTRNGTNRSSRISRGRFRPSARLTRSSTRTRNAPNPFHAGLGDFQLHFIELLYIVYKGACPFIGPSRIRPEMQHQTHSVQVWETFNCTLSLCIRGRVRPSVRHALDQKCSIKPILCRFS